MRNQPELPDRPDANCAPPKSALMMAPTIPPPLLNELIEVSYPQPQKSVKRESGSRLTLVVANFVALTESPLDATRDQLYLNQKRLDFR